MPSRALVVTLLSLTCLSLGCDHEDPCDDDVQASIGSCKPAPEPMPDAATDEDASATSDAQMTETTLGDVCSVSGEAPECGNDAPYCVKSPFEDTGYCSTSGCTLDGDDCPDGYSCFELGIPSVPLYCARD